MSYTLQKRIRAKSRAVVYYAESGGHFTPLSRSGPAPSPDEQQAVLVDACHKLAVLNAPGVVELAPERPGLEVVLRAYCAWARDNRPEQTYMAVRKVCRELLAVVGEKPFHEVQTADVERWRDWRLAQPGLSGGTVSPNTVRKEMVTVCQLWSFAVRRRWAAGNVVRYERHGEGGVKPPPVARARRVFGGTSQVLEALAQSEGNPTRKAAIYLLSATGLRIGELHSLRPSDVDLRLGVLHVPRLGDETTKRHERDIPLGKSTISVLETMLGLATRPEMPPGGTISQKDAQPYLFCCQDGRRPLSSHVGWWLKPVKLTPHSLRRWFQSQLEEFQCPTHVINGLMGHADPSFDPYSNPDAWLAKARPWVERVDAIIRVALNANPPYRPGSESPPVADLQGVGPSPVQAAQGGDWT